MERIRQRLLDETAGIKRGGLAKRQRELKKFSKQVQVEKLKEREKGKKEVQDKLRSLKRKRGGALNDPNKDDDAFDIALEDAASDHSSNRDKLSVSRSKKDAKFGFGGAGKRSKQNTRESTDNFEFSRGSG